MKAAVIAVGWALTVIAALLLGGALRVDAPHATESDADAEVARLRERVEELVAELEQRSERNTRSDGVGRVRHAATGESSRESGGAAAADAKSDASVDGAATPTFSLAAATSGAEASRELMAFVEVQLARGEAGHAAIMDAIVDIWTNRDMVQELFGDETQAVRELYPWIRFLVQHESDVVGLTDYVFRTMATDPMALENVPNADVLEIFTQGVAILLPGVVDEETLEKFRGYAQEILDTPKDKQPKAIQASRDDLERLLASFWAEPIDPLEALERLKSGDVPTGQIARMVRLVPPEMIAELDLVALALPLLRQGERDALTVLSASPSAPLDIWRADQALLEGMAAGKAQYWFLQQYFGSIGRAKWTDVRPFFDRALAAGGRSQSIAIQAFTSSLRGDMRPDGAYVEDLLSRYEIDEATSTRLRTLYGLGEAPR